MNRREFSKNSVLLGVGALADLIINCLVAETSPFPRTLCYLFQRMASGCTLVAGVLQWKIVS